MTQENLRAKAEKIINFTTRELSTITPEEIQRLFYDLQVYQIELQMQNEELQKVQLELAQANNRLNFMYHSVPVGILTLDYQGFIEKFNQTFAEMLMMDSKDLIKKHFSKFIFEQDKNIFIQRYDAFFKIPKNKSICLRLQGNKKTAFHVLLKANVDDGSDDNNHMIDLKSRKLIVTVSDVNDMVK